MSTKAEILSFCLWGVNTGLILFLSMEATLGQSLAAFVSAGLGAMLAISIGVSHRQLCALISVAAGTLLSATFFHIIPEAWDVLSPLSIILALASGYGFFFLMSRYVSHVCPACAASHFEDQSHSKLKNVFFLLVIALTIHSMMDGIAIALGNEMAEGTRHSIFFTIAIHKLPEGLALCALLLGSGRERVRAFLWALALESSTIWGWAIGHFFLQGHLNHLWMDFVMVHIAGGFVYLSLHAAINEMKDHSSRFILIFFLLGFLFMALMR